jgi:pimeloyl-ACP methyl ester carboxylesterase
MLGTDYQVLSLELPGFGLSPMPAGVWGSFEYAECIAQALKTLEFATPLCVVGHSFGGKIALLLASRGHIVPRSLALIGTPGVRTEQPRRINLRIAASKILKTISRVVPATLRRSLEPLRVGLGSRDYQEAGDLRPILVKVVNEDLRAELPRLSLPVLLLWGTDDEAVPLDVALTMAELIPDSHLATLPGSHYPFIDSAREFSSILRSHLKSLTQEDAPQ